MEYDVEIRPTKFVKGQGLEKLLVDSNCESLGLHLMAEHSIQEELQTRQGKEQIMDKYAELEWYADIIYFLLHLQCPMHLDMKAARSIKLKATKYCLVNQQLHWKYPGGVLLRCLKKPEIEEVILELH